MGNLRFTPPPSPLFPQVSFLFPPGFREAIAHLFFSLFFSGFTSRVVAAPPFSPFPPPCDTSTLPSFSPLGKGDLFPGSLFFFFFPPPKKTLLCVKLYSIPLFFFPLRLYSFPVIPFPSSPPNRGVFPFLFFPSPPFSTGPTFFFVSQTSVIPNYPSFFFPSPFSEIDGDPFPIFFSFPLRWSSLFDRRKVPKPPFFLLGIPPPQQLPRAENDHPLPPV